MTYLVSRLETTDASAFRDLRLTALRAHPEAFGASWEQESARPISFFANRLASHAVFAGKLAEGLAGMAGLMTNGSAKLAHKAVLWGMFVRDEARGSGLAEALVHAVIGEAAARAEELRLSVVATNEAAIRLYRRCGFQEYGCEPRALKVAGRYYDEVLMARRLSTEDCAR